MIRFAPYIAIILLAVTAWGLWQRGKALKLEAAHAKAREQAALQVITAHKALQKELHQLRADYEKRERELRAIPDDGCLDRNIPDALGLLLAPVGKDGNPSAGAERGTDDGR